MFEFEIGVFEIGVFEIGVFEIGVLEIGFASPRVEIGGFESEVLNFKPIDIALSSLSSLMGVND